MDKKRAPPNGRAETKPQLWLSTMDYMFNVVVKRPHGKPCEMMYVQAEGLDEALRRLNQKIKDFGMEVEEIKSNYFENGLSRVMYSHSGAS